MRKITGSTKTNRLVLQGHGETSENVQLYVHNDKFTMSQGNDILFEVVKSEVLDDGYLEIGKTTHVQGDLEVSGDAVFNGTLQVNGKNIADIVSDNKQKIQDILNGSGNTDSSNYSAIMDLIGVGGSLRNQIKLIQLNLDTPRLVFLPTNM